MKTKLRRFGALFLSLIMAVSVLAGIPSAEVSAAPKKYVKSLKVSKSSLTLKGGAKATVKATVSTKGSVSKKVSVSLSKADKKYVTVKAGKANKKGVTSLTITAKKVTKAKTVKVKVTTAGKNNKSKKLSKTIKVKVQAYKKPAPNTPVPPKTVKVTGIYLDQGTNSLTMLRNKTTKLTYTIVPSNATNKAVTWTTSDPKVATVSPDGTVTAVDVGEAVITVKTQDGGYTDTCKVKVKWDETTSIENGIEVTCDDDNMLGKYSDTKNNLFTALMGRSLLLKARVMQDGRPLGNQKVKVTIEDLYGWGDDKIYLIEGKDTLRYETTNNDGYLEIPIDLTSSSSKQTPVSGDFMSYKVTFSYSQVSEEAKVQFATLQVPAPEVLNEENLEMGINAKKAMKDAGIREENMDARVLVWGSDKRTRNMYVASQQVSLPDKDHSLQISAEPYLMLPPSEVNEEGKEYKKIIDYASGAYGVYNDDTDETSPTYYKSDILPAGLEYASIVFSKYKLSEHTKLIVKFYYLDDDYNIDTEIDPDVVELTGSSDKEIAKQISPKDNKAMRIVVSLHSEGQVDTTENDGYVIDRLEGRFTGKKLKYGIITPVEGTVSWEKSSYTPAKEEGGITEAQLAKYLGAGNPYNNTAQYDYSCTVPNFPNVGNAIIEVKQKNTNTVERYFTYYSHRNDNNQNVLMKYTPNEFGNAVLVGESEATDIEVGYVTPSGNVVKVDSADAGSTSLKAALNFASLGISSKEQTTWYDSHLYSYVQWAPVSNLQIEEAYNYYAAIGQKVSIVAKLFDNRGNEVSQEGESLKFSLDNTNATAQGEEVQLKDFVEGTLNTKTDKNGETKFSVMNSDKYDFMERLTATTPYYNVRFSVNGSKDYKPIVTIQWITPGLYYKSSVNYNDNKNDVPETIEVYGRESMTASKHMDHKVGKTWQLGTKVIGKLPERLPENEGWSVYAIKGVAPDMITNNPATKKECSNGVMTLYSEKIGKDTITATLEAQSFAADNIQFVLAKLDADGKIMRDKDDRLLVKTVDCAGTGEAGAVQAKITWPFQWVVNGRNCKIVSPVGQQLEAGVAADVYISMYDKYDNPIAGYDVTYSVSGHSTATVNVTDKKATTNTNGLIKIALPEMQLATGVDSQRVTIEVTTPQDVEPLTITYSRDPVSNRVMTATLVGSNQINVKFSGSVSGKTQDLFVAPSTVAPEAFLVTVANATQKVTDAVLGADGQTITLTMEKELPTGTVTVKTQKYTDSNKMLSQLLTKFGQSLTGATATAKKASN